MGSFPAWTGNAISGPESWYSPIGNYFDQNRNTLLGLSAGFLSGDLGNVPAFAAKGRQADDAYATTKKAEAQRQAEINQTAHFIAKTRPDLLDLPIDKAWSIYLQDSAAKGADPFTLGPGQSRFDGGGNQIASMPAAQQQPSDTTDVGNYKFYANDELANHRKPKAFADWTAAEKAAAPSQPAAIQEYEYAKAQGFTGTFAEYETQMKRAGATSLTFNGEQSNAATFADRMKAAEPILQSTEGVQTDMGQQALNAVPFGLGNFMQKPEFQQAMQAQRDFVNAVLRKESGAAISPSEFDSARQQYFPQPGDSPQVIAQKRQNRAIAIAGMERSGGPAYNNPSATGAGIVDWTQYFGGQ